MNNKTRGSENSLFFRKKFAFSIASAISLCTSLSLYADKNDIFSVEMSDQTMRTAAMVLAEKTGVQIILAKGVSADTPLQNIKGNFVLNSALDQLLSGTGLTYEYSSNDMLIVKKSDENGAKKADVDKNLSIEEVTVTGSRISRTNFDTPTPVQSIDQAAIERSGFNSIGDILIRTPAVGVGLGPSNAQSNPDAGSVFVNLRGLGTDRTLTLINGRRRVSGSNLSSAVDLSTIPTSMIEKVEIITGGASAVYGADAVTGVVNIKLKEDFEGLELSTRTGLSQEGDTESYTLGLAGGTKFADDRGSISMGVTYIKDNPLMFRDRSYSRVNQSSWPNPANTGPNDGIPDNFTLSDWRIPATHPAGTFLINGDRYTVDPGLRLVQNDVSYGFLAQGGDGFDGGRWNQLRVGTETVSGLVSMNYELLDNVNLFADVNFANTKTQSPAQPTFDYGLSIARENPFIPDDLGALMDANGLTGLSVDRTHYDHNAVTDNFKRDTYTIVAGLDGEFDNGMNWEFFYQYGTYNTIKRQKTRIINRFLDAIDVIADPETGDPICRSAEARAAGCVPLNILGQDAATDDALAYFQHVRLGDVRNTQSISGLSLTGDLFDLPAGSLSFAVGGEYRKETLSARDDGLAVTGLLDQVFSAGFQPIDAEFDVYEAYAEVLAPILVDKPFAKALNLEFAVRFSDYSTIGATTAWKVGGDWSPTENLRFRTTRSRSVRAPNLNELFNPGILLGAAYTDPCDAVRINDNANRLANCRALGIPEGWVDPSATFSELEYKGGNPALEEETSDSWTIGVIYTPSFIEGLSVSVDFWDITIDGAINALPGQQTVDKCVDSGSLDNAFCPLIDRGSDFAIDVVDTSEINIGELSAKGFDFQAAYNFDIGALPGDFQLTLNGTYLVEHEELVDAQDPLSLLVNDGEFNNPDWRINLGLSYRQDAMLVNWSTRYIDRSVVDAQASPEFIDYPYVASRIYHDVTVNYAFDSGYDLSLGINNVFDREPPNNAYTYHGAFSASLYDSIGRYFFVGAKLRF